MQRILGTIGIVVAVGIALWLSVLLFAGLAVIGVIGFGLYYARDFLIQKGILNPTLGVTPEPPAQGTIIEGDFQHVDHDKEPTP